jgi:hypothetical protein
MALRTTPSVEGAAERMKAISASAIYSVGMVAGAALWALMASAIGGLAPPQAILGITAAVAFFYGAVGLAGRQPPLPQRSWQVPQSWFRALGIWAFAPAGFTLGFGVVTPIRYASFIVWTGLLAVLSPAIAVIVGVLYGILRTVPNWRGSFGTPTLGISDPGCLARRRNSYLRIVNLVMLLAALGIALSWTAGASAARRSGFAPTADTERGRLFQSAEGQCSPSAIRLKIRRFIKSFNNGDGRRIRTFLSRDAAFQPYNGRRITDIARFVWLQHSQGIRWAIFSFGSPTRLQSARATLSVVLRVRQHGEMVSEGRVGVVLSCGTGRIIRWSADAAAPPGKVNAVAVRANFAVEGTDPGLIGRCKPLLVERQLRQMLEAFNRGLGWTFESNFQPLQRFDPYNGSRSRGRSYPAGIIPFVRARWRAGDGWTGISLRLPAVSGSSDGVFSLRLQVTQRGKVVSEGGTKIAIACQSGKIIHWVGPLIGP